MASGPWRLGLRRLRRNKVALAFGVLFVLLVAGLPGRAAVGQPRGRHAARREPPDRHDRRRRQEEERRRARWRADRAAVLKADGKFFLGADSNGRDIMVRLLYGGRNSLLDRDRGSADDHGAVDHPRADRGLLPRLVRRRRSEPLLDVMWSFPVVILGVALGVALALGGLKLGPITIAGDSLAIPIFIIGIVYVPVHGAADPRAGAVAAREGVRRGRARAGRGAAADHVHARSCRTCPRRCSSSSRC